MEGEMREKLLYLLMLIVTLFAISCNLFKESPKKAAKRIFFSFVESESKCIESMKNEVLIAYKGEFQTVTEHDIIYKCRNLSSRFSSRLSPKIMQDELNKTKFEEISNNGNIAHVKMSDSEGVISILKLIKGEKGWQLVLGGN